MILKKPLDTPIRYLKGIGPKREKSFKRLGINSVDDLLYYFPRRYEDRTKFTLIAKLIEGQVQTVRAKILSKVERRIFRRRQLNIIEVIVADASSKLSCVWFNQPYLKEYLKIGSSLILYGKTERYGSRLQMNSAEFEVISDSGDDSLNMARIVPIYTLPEGFTQRNLRKIINHALNEYLPQVNDFLAYDIRSRNNLLNLVKSLSNIHFPQDADTQKQAYERLAFEEFFLFQLPLALRKLRKREKKGISHNIDAELSRNFISRLPFKLTQAQEKVIAEIVLDMASSAAMQRLLQGDVGSGKTIVATLACIIAIQGGYQAALMVPTEILARQHFEKISSQIASSQGKEVKIELLTSSANKKEKEKIYKQIKEGKADLIIGTHALLEEEVVFKNLGLVVIDEQHKFGVGQRSLLPKKGFNPDVLIMTATPIPRTLAITLYGDLDISIINELPPGRPVIKTLLLKEKEKQQGYRIAREELRQGRQAFIVYPVIEESYALDIAGAKRMYEELKQDEFRGFKLGLVHGRLKQEEQDEIMRKFKDRELDALVSTTVLEVGIDIPNATCMIVESAERFGLSQLHQLRGRVGRGAETSFCLLISDCQTQEAKARLAAMVKFNDGFRIAEEDLKIRGPGEFFGSRQHGLTELKIGNPLTQMQLLRRAREEALRLLKIDPRLELKQDLPLKKRLLQRFPEYEKLMVVG
ncbi:MAG: ATP-dependent DNA helicase RecG [Candidatus Omnitrophica bacterium]|nr:ATP-dependent DNA helicase RecG [Candidatus Omnitrophota bacterium]